jgi:beta-lactamase regulating signal transducer with metallopeptidase domain
MNELLVSVAETGPSLTIRVTVLFAAAAGVALALGKASAAQRHLVWAAALATSLVLPAMHVCAPEWGVLPAFTAKHTSSPAMREAPMAGEGPSASMAVASFHESPRGAERAASAAVSPPALPPPPRAAALAISVSVGQALAVLWLTGVLLGCVRLALAAGRIRQLARRADPATGRTAALLTELARESGIRRPVRCLVSRQSIVPMTWGWLRPVVLLPADAASWSAERLRVVLLHELAHVRRGDAATQFVAELARSLYWFHPLAWWGVRCLRVEQEAACDDRVLAAGAAAEDYAEELVAVTARLPHGLQAAGLAVAMGRRHTIEGRVRGILADDRDRRPVRMVRAAVIGGVFAMLATVAAIVGPAADAEDKAANTGGETRGSAAAAAGAQEPADPLLSIRSLTPGEAARIVRDKEKEPSLREWYDFAKMRRFLSEMGYTDRQISATMREMKKSVWERFVTGESVSPSLQIVLNRFRECLFLPSLSTLDAETAKALASGETEAGRGTAFILDLPGLSTLDAATAAALVERRVENFILSLSGLRTLDANTASALVGRAENDWVLNLSGLQTLDADTASALAQGRAEWLVLRGLATLSPETAKALTSGRVQGLFLAGSVLNNTTAEALADVGKLGFYGLTALDKAAAKVLANGKVVSIFLPDLRDLDADTAAALASGNMRVLALPGLRTLDAATAKALASGKIKSLELAGLNSLDAATATALANGSLTYLTLSGVSTLDGETAAALANAKAKNIDLSGLTTLDAAAATALARGNMNDLVLPGLRTLDAATAKSLASGKINSLELAGLSTLDAAAATALVNGSISNLILAGLTTLDTETAAALANGKIENINLSGLSALDATAIEELAKCTGRVHTSSPESNSAIKAARWRLAARKTPAKLPSDTNTIESLTPEQARVLVQNALLEELVRRNPDERERARIFNHKETMDLYESWSILRLNGLTTLDAETAKVLAAFKGILDLDGLPAIDPEAARLLAGGNCKWLRLHGLKTLSPETARELVKSRLEGHAISLPQLDTLDVATAKVIATYDGQELILRGLVAIDVDVAKALAEYRGRLHLGLTTLDAETVEALAPAGYREKLSLDGLATLDADTAKALAQYKGSLVLRGLTTLDAPESVAIAKALATRKGPLALPNLKKISPKTLSALIEKEDIDIPLIETLELIPEPDGSPTEDFVIPERFQKR